MNTGRVRGLGLLLVVDAGQAKRIEPCIGNR